jgi:hypothetical protein
MSDALISGRGSHDPTSSEVFPWGHPPNARCVSWVTAPPDVGNYVGRSVWLHRREVQIWRRLAEELAWTLQPERKEMAVPKIVKSLFLLSAILVVLSFAVTSSADPGLGTVPPHRHWIQTSTGMVEVGPQVCDNPALQPAFNQFHNNLHAAGPTAIGPAAPGLHNLRGAEITFTGCLVALP